MITSFWDSRMRSQQRYNKGTTKPTTSLSGNSAFREIFTYLIESVHIKDKEGLLTYIHTHTQLNHSFNQTQRSTRMSYRKHLPLLMRPSIFSLVKSLVNALLVSQPPVPPYLLLLRKRGFYFPLGTKSH